MTIDDATRPVQARLTVLSGPSGVGKDSVIELIRARAPWVWLSVSVTTRKIRPNEIDGVHYHFVDRTEFDAPGRRRPAAGVGGVRRATCYGTPRARSRRGWPRGQPVLLEIDLQGARQVRAAMPEALLVFLAPPSWEELERRLVGRGTDDQETHPAPAGARPGGAGGRAGVRRDGRQRLRRARRRRAC